jgi:hypothetical protein
MTVHAPKGPKTYWPSWRYGPGGVAGVFQSEDDVPEGWTDHPAKVGVAVANGVQVAFEETYEPAPRKRPIPLKRNTT